VEASPSIAPETDVSAPAPEVASAPSPTSPAPATAAPTAAKRQRGGPIIWTNVITVFSVAILIAAEVLGAAYAAGWALGSLFELGDIGTQIVQALFVLGGIAVMVSFVRAARRVEPFVERS
jgi:hypothetical protein